MLAGITRGAVAAVLLAAVVAAQTAPEFEVASIRPADDQPDRANLGMHVSGSQVRITYMTLKDNIARAFRVTVDQVTGPDFIAQARFDIAGKIPDGVPATQVPEMLQALLAARFEMKSHHELRDFPVYALVVGKNGPRLRASAPVPDAPAAQPGTVNLTGTGNANGVTVDLGGGSSFNLANNQLVIERATATQLAAVFSRFADRPVIDDTGLTGTYDLTLDLSPDEYNSALMRSAVKAGVVLPPQALRMLDGAPGDPFSAGLQKFGLGLESRKTPFDIIVVDSMRKTPTGN